jgi:hypothetical protein
MTKIHEQLTGPHKWTRGVLGRDGHGNLIHDAQQLDRACRCCAVGWIYKVYGNGKKAERVKAKVRRRIKRYWITQWSDDATFKEVHSVFKELNL